MRFLEELFRSLLSTLLISVLLVLISFSAYTREFPPNISKIKAAIANLQQMTASTQKILSLSLQPQVPGGPSPIESFVAIPQKIETLQSELQATQGRLQALEQRMQLLEQSRPSAHAQTH